MSALILKFLLGILIKTLSKAIARHVQNVDTTIQDLHSEAMNQKSLREQKSFQKVFNNLYPENCDLKHLEISGQSKWDWTVALRSPRIQKLEGWNLEIFAIVGLWNPYV